MQFYNAIGGIVLSGLVGFALGSAFGRFLLAKLFRCLRKPPSGSSPCAPIVVGPIDRDPSPYWKNRLERTIVTSHARRMEQHPWPRHNISCC